MKVFIAADHAGFESKNSLITELEKKYTIHDMGPYELDPDDDYPIYAKKVSLAVKENPGSMGILICKSGEGMVIASNKIKGIRAVTVGNVEQAKETRRDNDSNVLSLSSKELSLREMNEISKAWLDTKFSGLERHQRRINEISQLEKDIL